MRVQIVEELEEFIRAGQMWDKDELGTLIRHLEEESDATEDPVPRLLSRPLTSLLWRMKIGELDPRFANDVEGIVYPRLWKVMEAVWDGLPDGELRTRIEVLNRRLARRFAEEQPG
ncbi:MAG: hypothetical protein QOG87_455 [Actinomycetota bacterium]